MLALILVVGIALAVSALCSILEAALYAVPISHVEALAAEGHPAGRRLKRLRDDVEGPISAILSLNTIAHTAGAAVGGALVAGLYGEDAVGWFSAILTLAILLLTEIIPKTLGVLYCRTLAPRLAWPLQLLIWSMLPLVWLSKGTTWLITRGRKPDTAVTDREMIVLAQLGLQAGSLDRWEVDVIRNILSIEHRAAGEIMTPWDRTERLEADESVATAEARSAFYRFSRMPVRDAAGAIVGVTHRPRLAEAIGDGRGDAPVRSLARPAVFVPRAMAANELLRKFLRERQHLFVVQEPDGAPAGIVTLEDVLEEILGREIEDETDRRPGSGRLSASTGKS